MRYRVSPSTSHAVTIARYMGFTAMISTRASMYMEIPSIDINGIFTCLIVTLGVLKYLSKWASLFLNAISDIIANKYTIVDDIP